MENEISALEARVASVVALCETLRAENRNLKAELVVARSEREAYGAKLDAARQRLETLVAQLPEE